VPNRNGVFLAVAAAYAEALGADRLVTGFNAEEAASFPDNSEEFARAYTRSLRFSTRNGVRVKCYTSRLRKPVIVALGLRIGAPMDLVWPCYEGGRRLCGRCESCMRFLRAVRQAGEEEWFRAHHAGMPRAKRQER
jgi:7-cyano-7-deazaguanine synthase